MNSEQFERIAACFENREAAERAIEHLVQEFGIDRSNVQVGPSNAENTSGSVDSVSDVAAHSDEGSAFPPALGGDIEVVAAVRPDEFAKIELALRSVGATDITGI